MILIVLLFLQNSAFGAFLPISGRVFGDVYVPTRNQNPTKPLQQASLSTWLESSPSLNETWTSKFVYSGTGFDGTYSSLSGNSQATHWESQLREGYISYSSPGFEVRVGEQMISWGKADVVNPTDFNTAKNLTFFNNDDEVRRLGSLSTHVLWTPDEGKSPWGLSFVWTPVFAQTKLLFPPNFISANANVGDPTTPPVEIENSEVAIKGAYAGQGWDISLSGFSGYSHMPELQMQSYVLVGATPLVNLSQVFRKIWAVGSDGSFSSDKWVFRYETAFIQTPNSDGSNMTEEPSHWDSAIGFERPLGKNFRVQPQLLIRYFPYYSSPANASGPDPVTTQINRLIATSNALLLQYQDPTRPGATLRLGYDDDGSGWNAELFLLMNFNGGDFLFRPKVSHAWTDVVRSTLGVELYNGPSTQPLGALNPYSSVFTETKWTF